MIQSGGGKRFPPLLFFTLTFENAWNNNALVVRSSQNMRVDFISFYKRLGEEVKSTADFSLSMKKMMEWCYSQFPHEAWRQVLCFDAEEEIYHASHWIEEAMFRAAAPFPVKGMWFGIAEFQDEFTGTYSDCSFDLFAEYDRLDPKCMWLYSRKRYQPHSAFLNSSGLRSGSIVMSTFHDEIPQSMGTVCFNLAFTTLLISHILTPNTFRVLRGTSSVARIGIATGFNGGDVLYLGELCLKGWQQSFRVA